MQNKWYTTFKALWGPFIHLYNRPVLLGADNVPEEGPVIIASNHQAVMDSFYLPLMMDRQIQFPAKMEYFTTPGLVGRAQKWFFTAVGQIPVDRDADNAGEATINAARQVLDKGGVFGIYPEGTRSPDGRIYKGRTGMARIAMVTGVPVIPAAMMNTRDANPIGTWILRPAKIRMALGKPIDPHAWARDNGYDPEDVYSVARPFTDHVMKELSQLTGHPYVDMYASDIKESLSLGHGYPSGAEKGGELEILPTRSTTPKKRSRKNLWQKFRNSRLGKRLTRSQKKSAD